MNSVGWFEIYVDDLNRAREFYEGVFNKKLESLPSPDSEIELLAFPGEMNQYGANGALVKMTGMSAGKNSVLVYFSCEDCAVEQERVTKFGGQVVKPKFSIGNYGHISLVQDSEANMIGLHSMK